MFDKQTEVNCEVKNCIHNNKENNCTASTISVGPTHANTKTDTICATFCEE